MNQANWRKPLTTSTRFHASVKLPTFSVCALALTVCSTNAIAALPTGEYQIVSKHSQLCLDISGVSTANGANVQQWGCWTGANNQRFQITDMGNGAYSIVAKHSGKALDAANWGTTNGTPLQQWDWFGGNNQQWEIRSTTSGYEIRPRHALNLCMDVAAYSTANGGNIHLWSCHGQNNQKWTLKNLDNPDDTGGGSTGGTTTTTTVNGANFSSKSTGGASTDNGWNIWSNGYIQHNISFSNPTTLKIEAKGDYANNAWPNMKLSVGGTVIANTTVNSNTWKTFTYTVSGKTGSQAVKIEFTNDYASAGQDRNLHIKSATAVTNGDTSGGNTGGGNTGGGTSGNAVEQHGQLRVNGVNLVDKNGSNYQLRGMSSHGLHWFGQYMNPSSIQWMRDDWKANVVRAAMYTAEGGYISNPSVKDKVIETVNAAIAKGVYVIIDWHILADNDPNQYKPQAIEFFKDMARRYGNYPNVIYEIANEPNGSVNWNNQIRPYAVDVIREIRQIDPDNIIIVGTGTWSQDIHHAADNPLPYSNVMYTLHFYAGTHGQYLRDRVDYARSKNAAIFVTEWGTSQASGDGGVYENDTRTWINFLNSRGISWVNWSLCDKNEASAALAGGASATGGWNDWNLSPSGKLVRSLMRAQ